MQTTAKLRHLRQSPRKVRLVADLIRGLEVGHALDELKFVKKRSTAPLIKLINSAVANAEHNHKLKKENLFIKEIRVDQGPILKRWRPRAFGRAGAIQKKTSHISLVLAEIKPTGKEGGKKYDKVKKQKDKQVKVVKSLDEIKQAAGEGVGAKAGIKASKGKQQDDSQRLEGPDSGRAVAGQSKQHLDKFSKKEKAGTLKRMFRRKSI